MEREARMGGKNDDKSLLVGCSTILAGLLAVAKWIVEVVFLVAGIQFFLG